MAEGIDRYEFESWMKLLRDDVQGVHTRLDVLNGRTRTVETEIAVLKDRSANGGKHGAVAGGAVAFLVGVFEVVRHVFSKP